MWGPNLPITNLKTLIDPLDPKFGLVTLLYVTNINDIGEIVDCCSTPKSATTAASG